MSPLYLFERSDVGLVLLDRELKVLAMNSLSTKSSSLVVVATLPRPPRRCALKAVTGWALM